MERSGNWRVAVVGLIVAVAWLAPACRREKPQEASREELTTLLRKEAEVTKSAGEHIDPSLGMKSTWMLTDLAVREQPGNADYPWAGSVKFLVRSETRDMDKMSIKETDRQYEYRWSSMLKRWILQP
jgi:hypothetical protein